MTQSRSETKGRCCPRLAMFVCLILGVSSCGLLQAAALGQATPVGTAQSPSGSGTALPTLQLIDQRDPGFTTAQRTEQPEKIIEPITTTGDRTERPFRSTNMLIHELVTYFWWIAVALTVMAVGFPVTIWLMGRKRLVELRASSDKLAATLLMVEERQSNIANVLKKIQHEGDDLQKMSGRDLQAFIAQAKKYLERNELDLEKPGGQETSEDARS